MKGQEGDVSWYSTIGQYENLAKATERGSGGSRWMLHAKNAGCEKRAADGKALARARPSQQFVIFYIPLVLRSS